MLCMILDALLTHKRPNFRPEESILKRKSKLLFRGQNSLKEMLVHI